MADTEEVSGIGRLERVLARCDRRYNSWDSSRGAIQGWICQLTGDLSALMLNLNIIQIILIVYKL